MLALMSDSLAINCHHILCIWRRYLEAANQLVMPLEQNPKKKATEHLMCATARHRPGLRVLRVPVHLLPGGLMPWLHAIGSLSWTIAVRKGTDSDLTGLFALTAPKQGDRNFLCAACRRSQSAPRAGRPLRRPRPAASARRVRARRAGSAGASRRTRRHCLASQVYQAMSSEASVCLCSCIAWCAPEVSTVFECTLEL